MAKYIEEAERLLPCESDCCETHRVECPVAFRPAVAAALQAAAEDGKKKLAEMTHIRDFAIRCLIKATGATKEQVQAAPYELAVKIKAELAQLRAENERLKGDIAKLTAERDAASHCGTCNGSGVVDSGGVTPWDAPIDIACPECKAKRDAIAAEIAKRKEPA